MVKKFSLILLLFIAFLDNTATSSVNTIAKVNDEIITSFDFNERVKLFSILNNLPASYSPEVKKEILDTLINDKLYLIAAKTNKINISDSDIKERVAKIINEYPELKSNIKALKSYITANITWINLIQKKFINKIIVQPSEIIEEIKNQKKDIKYSFRQAVIDTNLFENELKEKILSVKNCEQLDPILKSFFLSPSIAIILPINEIREEVKHLFNNASLNKTQAIVIGNSIQIINICKIITTNYSEEEARQVIFENKLQKYADEYLKTIKSEAIIEVFNN